MTPRPCTASPPFAALDAALRCCSLAPSWPLQRANLRCLATCTPTARLHLRPVLYANSVQAAAHGQLRTQAMRAAAPAACYPSKLAFGRDRGFERDPPCKRPPYCWPAPEHGARLLASRPGSLAGEGVSSHPPRRRPALGGAAARHPEACWAGCGLWAVWGGGQPGHAQALQLINLWFHNA